MEHRGIWAAVGACLVAGALVAPPGSALAPQRLIAEALQPVVVSPARPVPSATAPADASPAVDRPAPAAAVPVLIEAAPQTEPPAVVTDSVQRSQPSAPRSQPPPRQSTPPKASTAPTTAAPAKPAAPASSPAKPPPAAAPPATKPPANNPPATNPPAVSKPEPVIKQPIKRWAQPVQPGPPVVKGVPKSAQKADSTSLSNKSGTATASKSTDKQTYSVAKGSARHGKSRHSGSCQAAWLSW